MFHLVERLQDQGAQEAKGTTACLRCAERDVHNSGHQPKDLQTVTGQSVPRSPLQPTFTELHTVRLSVTGGGGRAVRNRPNPQIPQTPISGGLLLLFSSTQR